MMTASTGMNRRNFFKVAATSGAGAALASCNNDGVETLLPRITPPDDMIIGQPYFFNTTCKECTANCGITVKTREGRALSVSGNRTHPVNRGGVCAVGQSTMQGLYNPARIKTPLSDGNQLQWDNALNQLVDKISAAKNAGKKIVFLSTPETGSLSALIDEFLVPLDGERVDFDMNPDNTVRLASQKLFGVYEKPQYQFDKAESLINFGSDFLESWGGPVENGKNFAEMFSYKNGKKARFFHVSPHLNLTGSNADSWLACDTGTEVFVAYLLINAILEKSGVEQTIKDQIKEITGAYTPAKVSELTKISETKLQNLLNVATATKLQAISGGNQTAGHAAFSLHYAVLLYNYLAGNINSNVNYGLETASPYANIDRIQTLISDAKNGNLGVLIINGVNPIYSLPAFAEVINGADFTATLDVSQTETTKVSDLVLPASHFLESWGDSQVRKGIYSLIQPVMAGVPGYDSRQTGDIILQLSVLLNLTEGNLSSPGFKDYLKMKWMEIAQNNNQTNLFDKFWVNSLKNGGFFKQAEPVKVELQADFNDLNDSQKVSDVVSDSLKLTAVNSVFQNMSGQTGDKLWLLEIPHPITQIVWDSWVEINTDRAVEMGINHGDEVEVITEFGKANFGAYVYHGVSKNAVVIPTGLGREVLFPNYSQRRNAFLPFTPDNPKELKTYKVGKNAGNLTGFVFNSTGSDLVYNGIDVTIKKTGKQAGFVSVDGQYRNDKEALISDSKAKFGDRSQKGRGILQDITLDELSVEGSGDKGHHLLSRNYTVDTIDKWDFYYPMPETAKESIFFKKPNDDPQYYDPYKFEMVIDLDKCTGCSSCVVACYAENNVAVVGKERQSLGREMSWIRIERFFDKNEDGEMVTNMIPTMCQQCGNAGCEPVCPVYATYHNPDGLNVQVYNRCVGTRYCANNCIYKQRRFNWRTYEFPAPLHFQLNPDVSARTKGVMEKCTFCIQRIAYAKDAAKDENRVVRDGEILTACQSACPTSAISFGNAVDPNSQVSKQKKSKRKYTMFEIINFKPSVSYLKKVRPKTTV